MSETDLSSREKPIPPKHQELGVSVAAIIPAFDEGERLLPVLDALLPLSEVTQVIVVDDGSRDNTAEIARAHPLFAQRRLHLHQHPVNRGKGAALYTGASCATASVLLLLDADLTGVTPAHIGALLAPVVQGETDMTVGVFRDGRAATTLSHLLVPVISGQRALRRETLLSVPFLDDSGFGVEVALTRHWRKEGFSTRYVEWEGVSHVMKEEKFGAVRGLTCHLRMYFQMAVFLFRTGKA